MDAVNQSVPAQFDAASLMPDSDSCEVQIKNLLTKKPTGIFITVLSKDSETYRDVQKAQANVRFKQFGKRNSSSLTAEELEEESIQVLVSCTKAWRNMVYNGEELECTADNVRKIYENIPMIREQVDDAIHDRGNFKKR
jgi:hypothetical protein